MTTIVREHEPGYSVLRFLQEESTHRTVSPDLWDQLQQEYGQRLYSELLYYLTQVRFDPDEARRHWDSILKHRESMNSALGRDVGLRVALADYFVNVTQQVDNAIIVEITPFSKSRRAGPA